MALATTWTTLNAIGVDIAAIWSSTANAAGTYGENVQPYAPFDAGMIANSLNGGVSVYVKVGTGGVTGLGYAMVVLLGDYTNAVMMSNSVGSPGDKVGVWLGNGAAVAGDYGWVQLFGSCPSVQTNVATVSTAMASTSTAGQIDDATGTGTKNISGLVLTTAKTTSAGLAPCQLNWPVVGTTN